jgi:hypothetical protein
MVVVACITTCCIGYAVGQFPAKTQEKKTVVETESTGPCANPMKNQGVPTFKKRQELGSIIECEKMFVGVELGIQSGVFSTQNLERWPSFWMVDV